MHRILIPITLIIISVVGSSIVVPKKYNDTFGVFSNDDSIRLVVENMTIEEKIGQVFMVPVYSNRSSFHKKEIIALIEKHHIGGVIFMKGHPYKQYKWTKAFNSKSKIPLFVAMDAEWGLSMRLDSVIKYPKQMTMGAIENNKLIRRFAKNVGQQMQLMGVNVSFGPVVDINSNPANPVIHMRSFGESKYDVADKAIQYLLGLQNNGVIAVAKHFPGHGDTYLDSHLELPKIEHSKRRINRVELYPFERVFASGIAGTMTAHLNVPAYMGNDEGPASLSEKVSDKLLRRGLDFEGLTFSDALNMKAVTKYVPESEIDLKAFEAGNDILLFPATLEQSVEKIKSAIAKGQISETTLNQKVIRILKAKSWINKKRNSPDTVLTAKSLFDSLNTPEYRKVNNQIAEASNTLLENKLGKAFKNLHDTLLLIKANENNETIFESALKQYAPVRSIALDKLSELKNRNRYKKVVIGLFNSNPYRVASNFNYNKELVARVQAAMSSFSAPTVTVNFGTPYLINSLSEHQVILQCYEQLPEIQMSAAQAIYGAVSITGNLPVSTNDYDFGEGKTSKSRDLLAYGLPEQVGLSSKNLNRIDSIAHNAIKKGATPGCQVLVAKNGRVIYQKAFGHFDYDSTVSISNSKLYDVASITKVMASTMLLMRFYELGEIDLDKTLYDYLGAEVDSTKMDLTLREILTHQSGLSAWIPFYKYTLTEGGMCDSNYCYAPNTFFKLKVADSLFVQEGIKDTIYKMINSSKMKVRGKYLYSDLGYFYMLKILEKINPGAYEQYLYANFYNSLGMQHTMYNPLGVYGKTEIVPTENDNYFRQQLVHGYVHDPAAAMMGGIAGHAGVFSNANDVAKLFQMLLQKGSYNQVNYFEPETVKLFTSKQYETNRKGIGFDKPEKRKGVPGPLISDVSPLTFGHTGFTGTCVWADPEHDLIYVFLSNRVFPTAENKKLISMNVRTDILQVVYDDLLNKIP
ncbi:MAG: serine hydrolase [Bacteroidia bacterium]